MTPPPEKPEAQIWLQKNIQYDGEGDSVCPHCKKVIIKGRSWLYHYESMSHNFINFLGFKEGTANFDAVHEIICDIAHNGEITGKPTNDAKRIIDKIWERIYG